MTVEQLYESPGDNCEALSGNGRSPMLGPDISMFLKLSIALFDPAHEHDKESNIECKVEHKNKDHHNSIPKSTELEGKEDLSGRTEELQSTHHQDEIGQESMSRLDSVGND